MDALNSEIPTLCEASLVISAWERLHTHADLLALGLPKEPTRANLDKVNVSAVASSTAPSTLAIEKANLVSIVIGYRNSEQSIC